MICADPEAKQLSAQFGATAVAKALRKVLARARSRLSGPGEQVPSIVDRLNAALGAVTPVIVSRGEMVEISGRIWAPDIVAQSGASPWVKAMPVSGQLRASGDELNLD